MSEPTTTNFTPQPMTPARLIAAQLYHKIINRTGGLRGEEITIVLQARTELARLDEIEDLVRKLLTSQPEETTAIMNQLRQRVTVTGAAK